MSGELPMELFKRQSPKEDPWSSQLPTVGTSTGHSNTDDTSRPSEIQPAGGTTPRAGRKRGCPSDAPTTGHSVKKRISKSITVVETTAGTASSQWNCPILEKANRQKVRVTGAERDGKDKGKATNRTSEGTDKGGNSRAGLKPGCSETFGTQQERLQHLILSHGGNCCPICFIRLKRALEDDGQRVPAHELEDLFKSAFWGHFSYLREHVRSQHLYRWRCQRCNQQKPWSAIRYGSHNPCRNRTATSIVAEADNECKPSLNGIIENRVPQELDIALDKALGGKNMSKRRLASLLFEYRNQVRDFPNNLDKKDLLAALQFKSDEDCGDVDPETDGNEETHNQDPVGTWTVINPNLMPENEPLFQQLHGLETADNHDREADSGTSLRYDWFTAQEVSNSHQSVYMDPIPLDLPSVPSEYWPFEDYEQPLVNQDIPDPVADHVDVRVTEPAYMYQKHTVSGITRTPPPTLDAPQVVRHSSIAPEYFLGSKPTGSRLPEQNPDAHPHDSQQLADDHACNEGFDFFGWNDRWRN